MKAVLVMFTSNNLIVLCIMKKSIKTKSIFVWVPYNHKMVAKKPVVSKAFLSMRKVAMYN